MPAGRGEIPAENAALGRLHAHTLATDPARFWVADGGSRLDAFGSAVVRDDLWFLSMLFVRPGAQARGLGKALLERIGAAPGRGVSSDGGVRATATDAGQPTSNGLYGSLGLVPRLPLFNLVGRPRDGAVLPNLPSGISVSRVEPADTAWRTGGTTGAGGLQAEIDALDRSVLGFTRAIDHAYIRSEGRTAFVFRGSNGAVVGYGYTSAVGRLAPVTVTDPALLAPVVAHLLTVLPPRGASALWVPGAADALFVMLVGAGLRIEDLPVLLCWDRPFADWSRAIPISPGLL